MRPISDGKKRAIIVDWGMMKFSPEKDPVVFIECEFDENGSKERLRYTGGINKEDTRKYTLKTLLVCGFKDKNFERFVHGLNGNALPLGKEVEIVVDNYENKGKIWPRIKYINPIYKPKFESLSVADALAVTKTYNIEGELLVLHQEMGVKPNTHDDIPW